MSERRSPVESMPKKRKGETITLEPSDSILSSQNIMLIKQPQPSLVETHPADTTMLLKRCDTLSEADTMLLKRCDTLSETHPADTMLLKQPPCDMEVDDELDNETPSAFYREKGKPIDLKALLSTKDRDYLVSPISGERVPISSLDQNYVLLSAFSLPYPHYSFTPKICQSLQALYSELTQRKIDHTVKLVVVLKLNPPLDKDESAFRNFFSLLPLNCLAVPSSATNHIWHSRLALNPVGEEDFCCLAVHPDGTLLMDDFHFLNTYGALSFPFTDDHFDTIGRQDKRIKHMIRSPSPKHTNMATLPEILKRTHLRRIATESVSVPVSDLADATVGLYLYINGKSMDLIRDVHRKCKLQNRSFEIILVPLPFDTPDDPAVFCETMKKSALENSTSSTWWIYGFNDKICRALWRLLRCGPDDHLIILPSGGCPGDMYGKQIAFRYGMDAYPFTREVIVERELTELRSFTLESLLGKAHMMEHDLYNKNVVFYHGDPKCCHRNRDYKDILDNYPGTKVIFSHLGYDDIGNFQDIGWSIPRNICNTIFYHIFPDLHGCLYETTLVTFGKDGKILSRCGLLSLPRISTSSSASLFDDDLRDEIHGHLTAEMVAESCEEE